MQVGLLWFDSDPARALGVKIQEAARRYREKFGVPPDTCYVNSGAVGLLGGSDPGQFGSVAALRVVPAANILPHHFWVGVEENVG